MSETRRSKEFQTIVDTLWYDISWCYPNFQHLFGNCIKRIDDKTVVPLIETIFLFFNILVLHGFRPHFCEGHPGVTYFHPKDNKSNEKRTNAFSLKLLLFIKTTDANGKLIPMWGEHITLLNWVKWTFSLANCQNWTNPSTYLTFKFEHCN